MHGVELTCHVFPISNIATEGATLLDYLVLELKVYRVVEGLPHREVYRLNS